MNHFFWISIGAILGANARYWLGTWITQKTSSEFPFGTLLINLSGSLLIGFIMTLVTDRILDDVRWKLVLVIGFLGAFTTFSTFSYDNYLLLIKGAWIPGLVNILASAVVGIIAVAIGVMVAKLF
jgi:fluoride exporter